MPNTRSKTKIAASQEKVLPRSKVKTIGKEDKIVSNKRSSLRIIEKKKSLEKTNNDPDVYEFTYDPKEEPQPLKKKRKKVVKKRPPKTKTFVMKYYYDDNVSKAMANLKNVIKKITQQQDIHIADTTLNQYNDLKKIGGNNNNISTNVNEKHLETQKNCASIRVEDIAADFESIVDNHDDINYSPATSPHHPKSPDNQPLRSMRDQSRDRCDNDDPLNLRDDVSFFDDQPIANSSMNVSVRHPLASPWRAEFNNLPIKWQVNTYVKPDMTPAIESSFINFDDNKKRHVYTDMVPESNETLPDIVEKVTPTKLQTSILSFIKEVVEKKANKKRSGAMKLYKNNSIFEDTNSLLFNESAQNIQKAPRRLTTPMKTNSTTNVVENVSNDNKNTSVNKEIQQEHENILIEHSTPNKNTSTTVNKEMQQEHENILIEHSTPNKNTSTENTSCNSENMSKDKKNPKRLRKRKNKCDQNTEPVKTPCRNKDKNISYFGFDDTENQEQENVSPIKIVSNRNVQSLRSRPRAVLGDINAQIGPTRAALPALAARSKVAPSSEMISKFYDDIKSATDAPILSKNVEKNIEATDVDIPSLCEDVNNEDSQSVHLFEDIEVVHHLKATRKSYGNNKKVGFRTRSTSDSDIQDEEQHVVSNDEEDMDDLSFKIPSIKPKRTKKKKNPKQKMSKKEEQEADAWAAKFNSMCEDIDEFPLVVE